jgi:hypothetical protein
MSNSGTKRLKEAFLRQRGRPKLRWEDGVIEDDRKLEINWKNAAKNRE